MGSRLAVASSAKINLPRSPDGAAAGVRATFCSKASTSDFVADFEIFPDFLFILQAADIERAAAHPILAHVRLSELTDCTAGRGIDSDQRV